MSFGETIKKLRLERKQTLRQFCFEFGHDPVKGSERFFHHLVTKTPAAQEG